MDDIAKGLSYLHGKDIAHGDIKHVSTKLHHHNLKSALRIILPVTSMQNNILVGRDELGRLADFGLSRMLGSDGLAIDVSSSDGDRNSRWTAVEYFDFSDRNICPDGPTKAGDIWSLGCTVLVRSS